MVIALRRLSTIDTGYASIKVVTKADQIASPHGGCNLMMRKALQIVFAHFLRIPLIYI